MSLMEAAEMAYQGVPGGTSASPALASTSAASVASCATLGQLLEWQPSWSDLPWPNGACVSLICADAAIVLSNVRT
jgi:hypothetical protein